jgi:hypothetical protein
MRAIVALVCICCPLGSLPAQKNDGGWVTLAGSDLKGWKTLNGQAPFTVQNGEVVGTVINSDQSTFLATEATYGDFILEFEFRIDAGINSGVQLRSESNPQYRNGRVFGYQFEIDPSARAWTGGLYDESRRDWLYPLEYNIPAKSAFKAGEWNKARIECIGTTLRTFVNGIPGAHVVDNASSSGFIALQVHSSTNAADVGKTVRWRNLQICTTELKPSPLDEIFVVNLIPNTLSVQEKQNGVRLLFDGSTSTGWRGAYKQSFPEKGWTITDGAFKVSKASGGESAFGGDIVTEAEYSAFDFQFEFRLTEGANSGVKYFVTEKEGNKGSAIGLEFQILDDAKHPDAKEGVVGNRTQASLYDLIPSLKISRGQRPVGEWNWGRIIVYPDNRVEHWLNGYKVVEYHRGGPIYDALVARSKYAVWENFGLAEKGRLLLQDHGDEVWFRSLKIKELK